MKALGRHLIVEYYDCEPGILNDVALIHGIMQGAAKVSGATIVQEAYHHFSPHGVSGVEVIAESHMSIHTWPEYGYAAVDLFTCGEELLPDAAFEYLREHLEAKSVTVLELKSGVLAVTGDRPLPHKPVGAAAEA
ncbi:MAG: adenosylmethionine decarboxylase [Planctomycetes bacterium]|nr:adenosylmethionine decarboxylase [Planctomycetota bacterium]